MGRRRSINAKRPRVVATHPATPVKHGPVLVGQLAGVALGPKNSAGVTQITTVDVWDLSVKAVDGGGNSAVAAGDKIYYVTADTPVLSKKATGVLFGVAMGTVTTGATATIPVRLYG